MIDTSKNKYNGTAISINDNWYSVKKIKQLSVHAPLKNVEVNKLENFVSSGSTSIDKSEVRVCRINGKYVLLTGYFKVKMISNNPTHERQVITAKVVNKTSLNASVIYELDDLLAKYSQNRKSVH